MLCSIYYYQTFPPREDVLIFPFLSLSILQSVTLLFQGNTSHHRNLTESMITHFKLSLSCFLVQSAHIHLANCISFRFQMRTLFSTCIKHIHKHDVLVWTASKINADRSDWMAHDLQIKSQKPFIRSSLHLYKAS